MTACAIRGARARSFRLEGVASAAGFVVGVAGGNTLVRIVAAYTGEFAGALLIALADQETNGGKTNA